MLSARHLHPFGVARSRLPTLGLLLLSWLLPLGTWANETDTDEIDIRANFSNYWSAMSDSNFKAAAAYVHPLDLAGLRTEVLPVFLKASEGDAEGPVRVAEIFFDAVPREQRSKLSGPQLYVLFNNLMRTLVPEVYAAFNQSGREILEIELESPTKASLRYRILLGGRTAEATQVLGKFNGRWYLNMQQSPEEGAAKFRQAFGLK